MTCFTQLSSESEINKRHHGNFAYVFVYQHPIIDDSGKIPSRSCRLATMSQQREVIFFQQTLFVIHISVPANYITFRNQINYRP